MLKVSEGLDETDVPPLPKFQLYEYEDPPRTDESKDSCNGAIQEAVLSEMLT